MRTQARRVQEMVRPFAQRSAQPVADRNRKSGFGSIDQCLGDISIEDLAQQPFSLAVADFVMEGQSPSEFRQAAVEQGFARLQPDCHRGAIDLDENLIRQLANEIIEHHLPGWIVKGRGDDRVDGR